MHEYGLMTSIVHQAMQVADGPVVSVSVEAGELTCADPRHIEEHFRLVAQGTPLANAALHVVIRPGFGIRLTGVEVEE